MMKQKQKMYTWRAYYGETLLDELDGQAFSHLDTHGITSLVLLDRELRPLYAVQVPCGAQPIFRRREQQIIRAGESVYQTIHLIGWQHETEGAYLFAFEDGSCLLSDNFQAV